LEIKGKLLIVIGCDSEERKQAKEGSMLNEISTKMGPRIMERGQGCPSSAGRAKQFGRVPLGEERKAARDLYSRSA
jgi:hypothetical protein